MIIVIKNADRMGHDLADLPEGYLVLPEFNTLREFGSWTQKRVISHSRDERIYVLVPEAYPAPTVLLEEVAAFVVVAEKARGLIDVRGYAPDPITTLIRSEDPVEKAMGQVASALEHCAHEATRLDPKHPHARNYLSRIVTSLWHRMENGSRLQRYLAPLFPERPSS